MTIFISDMIDLHQEFDFFYSILDLFFFNFKERIFDFQGVYRVLLFIYNTAGCKKWAAVGIGYKIIAFKFPP